MFQIKGYLSLYLTLDLSRSAPEVKAKLRLRLQNADSSSTRGMSFSQGWNRLMFNILDLRVQAAPAALTSFVMQVPKLIRQGLTVEAIAKARADSFINPATGRLEASGFNNNYSRLLADQRSRAGVYDYKRRF